MTKEADSGKQSRQSGVLVTQAEFLEAVRAEAEEVLRERASRSVAELEADWRLSPLDK